MEDALEKLILSIALILPITAGAATFWKFQPGGQQKPGIPKPTPSPVMQNGRPGNPKPTPSPVIQRRGSNAVANQSGAGTAVRTKPKLKPRRQPSSIKFDGVDGETSRRKKP